MEKRLSFRLRVVLGVLFCMGISSVLAQEIPRPLFKEGDYWKFDYKVQHPLASVSNQLPSGTYTVVFKDGKLQIDDRDINITDIGVFRLAVPGLDRATPGLDSATHWYPFPITEGKTWKSELKVTISTSHGSRNSTLYSDFKAHKTERVIVPAGTFDALNLMRSTSVTLSFIQSSRTIRTETVYHYSSTTKSAVEASYSHSNPRDLEVRELKLIEYGNKP